MSARILIAEDQAAARERLGNQLCTSGFAVVSAADGLEALERFESERVDLVISDHRMPRLDGLGLLRAVRRIREVPFILYSSGAGPEVGFQAARCGAARFLAYPFRMEEQLLPAIAASLEAAREPRDAPARGADRFLGASAAAGRVRGLIRRLGPSRAAVLVVGETGAGKEVVARALHEESGRGKLRSFAVTELAETLLEAELFGHERGAFTGAVASRPGLFEQAHGGTLFLDEIGDAPPALQAKLLRVLETGEVRRVGGGSPHSVDVRVLAATHRDLETEVRQGRFRSDLFYRLRQALIHVPPLRERSGDIDLLVASALRELSARAGMGTPAVSADFLAALRAQPWPGNVRELRSLLHSVLLWWEGDGPLRPADLLEAQLALAPALGADERASVQRMVEAFRRAGGNQEAARRELGLTRAAWRHRWRRFGLGSLAR
jgi:two-component system response regulator AtoC